MGWREKLEKMGMMGKMSVSMTIANLRNARNARKELLEMMKEGRDFRSLPPLIKLIMGTVATLPGPKALHYLDEVERECIRFLKSLGFTAKRISGSTVVAKNNFHNYLFIARDLRAYCKCRFSTFLLSWEIS